MPSIKSEALAQVKADLVFALRRAAKSKRSKQLLAEAAEVARLTSLIAALEKIGLVGTRLHAI